MSDSDLVSLYSGPLLHLAATIPLTGQLSAPQGRAKKRSPLCGSSVSVDVTLREGRISEFAQDVRACALGQASASILGAVVIGRRPAELEAARRQLREMLQENGPVPDAPFEAYALMQAAREYRNRHASILLALDAVCEAVALAEAASETASAPPAPGPGIKKPPHVGTDGGGR